MIAMRTIARTVLAAAIAVAGLAAAPAQTPPPAAPAQIPLRDFFRNPEKTLFTLSADGQWIAYLAPYQSRLNVFVRPAAGGEAVRVTSETARDITGYFWKGSDTLVYVKDAGGDENFHLISVSRDGKTSHDLTPLPKVRAEIIDELEDDDTHFLVGLNRRKAEIFDVYRADVKTGELTLVAENPGNITSWYADHKGQVRLASTSDGVSTSLLYRAKEKDAFKPILTTTFRDSVVPQFFTFDNAKVYATSNLLRDKSALVVLDPLNAHEDKLLFVHPDVDVSRATYWRHRKVLACAEFTTWKQERKCFDPATVALYRKLEQKLPGYELQIAATDKLEDKLILRTRSDRTRGAFWLYERPTDKLTKLADVAPWLDEKQLAEMRPITYKSRDGLTISGYLTLPRGLTPDGPSAARAIPILVHPHGGPWARDEWQFNPAVQFFANRGYGVLQMNFRGSTGYGRKFWESSFKQWGGTMQNDISDGVKYLIERGIADPKHVCIYGGSYGGYATLAGLAFSPELYACGVDYVGVSNLFTFLKTIPPYWKPYLEMMYEMIGNPDKDQALLAARSPALHADQIRAPLLVAQGKNDPRVNINESNQMVEALRKRGIDVPYIVKDNEGHGFQNEENRLELYQTMEQFLAKYLKK
jgi:dipeptidyl aminopeptidase/acylaminoacyl peptidase